MKPSLTQLHSSKRLFNCLRLVIGLCHPCIDLAASGNWKLKEDQVHNRSPLTFLCHFCLEPCSSMLGEGMNNWVFFIRKTPLSGCLPVPVPTQHYSAFLSHPPNPSSLPSSKLLAQRPPMAHWSYGCSLWPSLLLVHASLRPTPLSLLPGGSLFPPSQAPIPHWLQISTQNLCLWLPSLNSPGSKFPISVLLGTH